MSFWYIPSGSSRVARLSLAVGAAACVLPFPIFGVHLPGLPSVQQNVLMGVFITSMGLCSIVGYKRPLLGLFVGPLFFFAVMCLACWYLASR